MYLFISGRVLDVGFTNMCCHFMCVNYVIFAVKAMEEIETTFILYASLAPNNNSGIKSAFWKIMTNTLALLPQPLPNPKLVIIKKSTMFGR